MTTIDVRRFADADDARRHYLGEVDGRAEQALAAIARPGLELVHAAKAADAARGAGPWLDAERAATGLDAASAARRILDARQLATERARAIEQARIAAKEAVRAAATPHEMHRAARRFVEHMESMHGEL